MHRWPSILAITTMVFFAGEVEAGRGTVPSSRPGMGAVPYLDEAPGGQQEWAWIQPNCPADPSGDGIVDVEDLLAVIAGWGTDAADLNFDGTTDVSDLLLVIGGWGPCPGSAWEQLGVGDPDASNSGNGEVIISIALDRFDGTPGDVIAFDVASTGVEIDHPGVDHLSRSDMATPWWYVPSVAGEFRSYTISSGGGDPLVYTDATGDVFDHDNLDIAEVRLWNDATHLHVAISVVGNLYAEDWSNFMVFIDAHPGGTGDNPWGRSVDLDGRLIDAFIGAWMEREDGSLFRVWAPNANEVTVAGSFNGWNFLADHLAWDGDGYWSADINGAVPGSEYRFVIRNGKDWFWRNDPWARRLTNSVGNSIVYDPGTYSWNDSFSMPDWKDLVIYEMHIGTFGVPDGGQAPGWINEATARLDHLSELGVSAVQLMPFFEFPGDTSWGYNPSYPFAVESHYGTPGDFKWFVEQAHARGIAVLVDVVYSHFGPSDLDLWQFDGWNENGGGGIYFYEDHRAETPWGPRPDFGRDGVRQYIRDNFMYWLNEFHMDGYRVDSAGYIHGTGDGEAIPEGWTLLQWLNNDVDATQPWKFITAEDMNSDHAITNDTGSGGAGFDSQWDPNFVHPVRAALEAGSDSERDMESVKNSILWTYSSNALARVIFTESHDEVANGSARLPEMICPGCADSWYSKKRSTLGAAVLMSSPGVPLLFMGQEFLEDGSWSDEVPLDWSRTSTFSGILQMYKDMIACRRNFWGQTEGLRGSNTNVHHQNNTDKILAWHRWQNGGGGDDVVIAANFSIQGQSGYRIGFPGPGTWYVRFNSDATAYDPSFAGWGSTTVTAEPTPWDGMDFSAEIEVGPYSAIFLSQ